MNRCASLAFLAVPTVNGGIMKKHNTPPYQIYPGGFVYVLPQPDSREPVVKSFQIGSFRLAYTITPRKFDHFGRCTHESRLLEISTKNGSLLLSRWE